jgi:DNA-binding NarL/FixJ family response regulator
MDLNCFANSLPAKIDSMPQSGDDTMTQRGQNLASVFSRQEMALARRTMDDSSQLVWRLLASGGEISCLHSAGIGSGELRAAARQALALNAERYRRTSRQQRLAENYPRAFQKWSGEEEARLLELHAAGKTLREIAAFVGRQPQSVKERLLRLKTSACS